jgi:hypothetical protein
MGARAACSGRASALGIVHAHLVVHGKPAVGPSEEREARALGDRTCSDEVREHGLAQALGEQLLGHRGQGHERAVGAERPVSGEHVDMGVEVRQVPEGLHEEDEAGPCAGEGEGAPQRNRHRPDTTRRSTTGNHLHLSTADRSSEGYSSLVKIQSAGVVKIRSAATLEVGSQQGKPVRVVPEKVALDRDLGYGLGLRRLQARALQQRSGALSRPRGRRRGRTPHPWRTSTPRCRATPPARRSRPPRRSAPSGSWRACSRCAAGSSG